MLSETFADPRVRAKLKPYTQKEYDVDRSRDAVHAYKVRSVPAYFVEGLGYYENKRGQGFRSADEFLAWLGE